MALTFYYGLPKGDFPMSIESSNVFSEEAYWLSDLASNMIWSAVTVANEEAKDAWLAAKNTWLTAAWTPNQHPLFDVVEENAGIRAQAEAEMQSLEISPSRS